MPTPYKTYTQEQWQQILNGARSAHDQAAVSDAVAALNQYEQDAVPPTTGEILGSETQGGKDFPGQAMHGVGQLLHQIGQGHIGEASRTVVGGLEHGMAGLVNLPGDAMGLAAGEDIPKPDILGHARDYGSSTAALATQAAPSAIGRFARAGSKEGLGAGLKAAVVGMSEPTGLVDGFQSTTGNVSRAASDASAVKPTTRPQPLTDAARGLSDAELEAQPLGQTPPIAKSAAAPGALDQALSRLTQKPSASDVPQFEEGLPAARTSTLPREPVARINSYLDKMAQGVGRSSASEYPRLAGSGPEGLGESGLLGHEAGFTTPETLALMVALGARLGGGAGLLKALKGINLGKVATDATMTTGTGAALTPDTSR